ncbi:hypothetical protein [Anabaena azotica]|uniref:Uncharacterized protein n=1 Tax=Anabaena azotica FACHB-119 TaxID=947527 RepID=A0ABR8DA65_9NOST|nr:hypothetical protein [Anabaena azotica]MBD2502628.1 hypothetical protein [Anabaena azotica FACHB-119]
MPTARYANRRGFKPRLKLILRIDVGVFWYSYLENPQPGNQLIKQDNPEMTDEQLAYGLQKLQK